MRSKKKTGAWPEREDHFVGLFIKSSNLQYRPIPPFSAESLLRRFISQTFRQISIINFIHISQFAIWHGGLNKYNIYSQSTSLKIKDKLALSYNDFDCVWKKIKPSKKL